MASFRTSESKGGRDPQSPPTLTWETLLPDLSASERSLLPELLESIRLPLVDPAAASGPVAPRADPAEVVRQWLAGSTTPVADLSASDGPAPSFANDRVGSAVFQIRNVPDGYLIRGAGGSGKTTAIRELFDAGGWRRLRILVLGGTPTATAEFLRPLPFGISLRTAGTPGEPAFDWAYWTQNLSNIIHDWIGNGILTREENRRDDERQLADLERLHHLPDDLVELEGVRARTENALALVRESLERELTGADDSPFWGERTAHETAHLARIAEQTALVESTRTEMAALQAELADLDTRHGQLEPLHLACENARWWSGDYWKARFDKSRLEGFRTLCERRAAIGARASELQRLEQHAEVETREAPSRLERWQRTHFDDELARRTAALQAILDDADTRIPEMRAEIEHLRQVRRDQDLNAGPFTPADYETLRTDLAVSISQDRQAGRLLGRFRQAAAGKETQLIPWLRNGLRLVVGSVDSVASDPFLNDPACPRFDYLLIDEAADLTEAQFVSLARRADKWIMTSACSLPPVKEEPRRNPGRAPIPRRGDLFARLWAALHKPTWSRECGRLLCRLEVVAVADRQYLEAEPVADNPQIEVRIYSPKDGEPRVAEVLFPLEFAPAQARIWLESELDEIALQPASVVRVWDTDADGGIHVRLYTPTLPTPAGELLRFRTPHLSFPPDSAVELGGGIVEYIAGLDTIGLTFAGPEWTLKKAEEWVQARTLRAYSARTCELRDSLRTLSESLCSQLRTIFGINLHSSSYSSEETDTFRFVEVPPLSERDRRDPHEVRGGAGLEVESVGFTNRPEAEAMLAEARAFARTSSDKELVLTALYPSQVQLLRELAAEAPLPENVKILAPGEISSHGANVLMIGLARSHASRAVPFGETPELILRLVTLARERLIVFGDPATLIRRSQWDKPLDPLDASASDREIRWVTGLVDAVVARQ